MTTIQREPWQAGLELAPERIDVRPAEPPRRPRATWPFWVALGAQALLLVAIPSARLAAYTSGQTIFLPTASVDPVDPLSGRYVALGYPSLGFAELEKLPGWKAVPQGRGTPLSVTFAPDPKGGPGSAWKAVAIAAAHPTALPPGQVAVRGVVGLDGLDLGVDRWHVDAARGPDLERALANLKVRSVAELRVDGAGTAALVGLRVNGEAY